LHFFSLLFNSSLKLFFFFLSFFFSKTDSSCCSIGRHKKMDCLSVVLFVQYWKYCISFRKKKHFPILLLYHIRKEKKGTQAHHSNVAYRKFNICMKMSPSICNTGILLTNGTWHMAQKGCQVCLAPVAGGEEMIRFGIWSQAFGTFDNYQQGKSDDFLSVLAETVGLGGIHFGDPNAIVHDQKFATYTEVY